MQAIVLRSWWRRSIGSLVLLALVAGLSIGVALGLVAGASRTRSSFDRFVAESRITDAAIDTTSLTRGQLDAIRALPGVRGVAEIAAGGIQIAGGETYLQMGMSTDGRYGVDVDAARIVSGRRVDPNRADEVVLPEPIASLLDKRVGDELR